MVPNIAPAGTSFHGALKYYSHDKRASKDEAHPTTSDRVAWMEVRNLTPGISAKAAGKIMGATARDAENLKRAAGKSTRGRKADDKNVYSYSLSWEPSEKPTDAEMLRAADETLKVLGADDRQAVIICHTDRDHSHVHVVLNMVSPIDGRKLNRDKDADKLSKWARDYERETGRIVTPERHKKWEARERHPDPAERRAHIDKVKIAAQERAHDRESQAQRLRELGEAQKAQHKDQWTQLSAAHKAEKDRIYEHHGERIKDAIDRHKVESKPIWAKHFKEARKDAHRYWYRDQSTAGRLRNAWEAAKHQKETGQIQGSMFRATMRNFFSNEERDRAFMQSQQMTRAELSQRLKSIIDREVNGMKAERRLALEQQRAKFDGERKALITRQNYERGTMREAWRAIPRQADRTDAKPYRGRRNDFRAERIRAARERQQDGRAPYGQKGTDMGKVFPTFEESRQELRQTVDEINARHEQREQAGIDKATKENMGKLQQAADKERSEAQAGASRAESQHRDKVQASDSGHARKVSAVEHVHNEKVQDRKAAYAAVRKSADAPMSTDDRKRAFTDAKAQVAAERQGRERIGLGKIRDSAERPDDDAAKRADRAEEQRTTRPRGPSWER